MTRPVATVLVASFGDNTAWTIPDVEIDRIRQRVPDVTVVHARNDDEVRRGLPEADVAFSWRVSGDLFTLARRLRWIQTPAAGIGAISPALRDSDVLVTNARGVHAAPIAEHVIGLMLALVRRLHVAMQRQAEGVWAQNELSTPPPPLIRDLTLGVVGLGSIGTEVARLALALGMRVVATRRRPEHGAPGGVTVWSASDLPRLLATADVVVLCAPLTEETRALIGREQIATMRPGALLINIARGKLVDEPALVDALRAGHLGGAALDVVTHEPLDAASHLWTAPNLILTPHIAGVRPHYWTLVTDLFLDNLTRFRDGRPLRNIVDKQAGY